MLASAPNAQGLRSLGGAIAARCRRPPRGRRDTVLGGLVERPPRLDRARGAPRGGCARGRRLPRTAAPGARAGGGRGALAARRLRRLERGLGALVDRARPLVGLLQPRARVSGARGGGDRRGLVRAAGGARVGLRAGARARPAARLGLADEGGALDRIGHGSGRAAERAARVLERARAALRHGAAVGAVAGGQAGARALVAGARGPLRLRARGGTAADLLARRGARRRGRGRALARARPAAGGERGGAAARRRRRAGRGRVGLLAAGPCGGRADVSRPRSRRRVVRSRIPVGGPRCGRVRVPGLDRGGAAAAERPAPAARWSGGARRARGRVGGRRDRARGRVQARGVVQGVHGSAHERRGAGGARPDHQRELVEPLALVEGGLAGVRKAAAARDGRRHLRADAPALADEQHRRDRAAQRAAAVPQRDGDRRTAACS